MNKNGTVLKLETVFGVKVSTSPGFNFFPKTIPRNITL